VFELAGIMGSERLTHLMLLADNGPQAGSRASEGARHFKALKMPSEELNNGSNLIRWARFRQAVLWA